MFLKPFPGGKGEHKAKMLFIPLMAEPDHPFTSEDLKAIEENLARLHESSVQRVYREAWQQCEMKGEHLPPAKALQNLVQIWKFLWKRR